MRVPHPTVDFRYIFSHCDQTKFEIPYYYDKVEWKKSETYRIRVSNIYDPSKFWVVLKDQELDIFQAYLLDFYTKYGDAYKMVLNSLARNMYCVAFTDKGFFRGVIISIPHSTSCKIQVCVFLFDFGYVTMVNFDSIYYLYEKLYEVPRFAVRASLIHIQPYDSPNWNIKTVKKFKDLVTDKLLLCVLAHTNRKRRIVEISIGNVNELSSIVDIGDVLISEKLARSVFIKYDYVTEKEDDRSRYIPVTKYPYLFPTFEAIETGLVPSSVHSLELLTHCTAKDILLRPYFMYRGRILR